LTCQQCADAQDNPRGDWFAVGCDSCTARALMVVTCPEDDIDRALQKLFGRSRERGAELVRQWRARDRAHIAAAAAAKGRR